jgi:hypothetical protein
MNSRRYSAEANEEFRDGGHADRLVLAGTERLGVCDATLLDLGDQFSGDFPRSAGEAALVSTTHIVACVPESALRFYGFPHAVRRELRAAVATSNSHFERMKGHPWLCRDHPPFNLRRSLPDED